MTAALINHRWSTYPHQWRTPTSHCLYCGKLEGDLEPCVPRLDVVPEGLVTTQVAHVKLGVSYATFTNRYQDRGLYPAALLGKKCTYLWDEAALQELAMSNVEWKEVSP